MTSKTKIAAPSLRASLIETGRSLLAEDGIEALSLRAVARAAGVSAMAPYRHFASKEALLAAIAVAGFERITRGVAEVLARNLEPQARLRAAAELYLGLALDDTEMFRLMFGNEITDKSAHAELDRASREAFASLVRLAASLPNPQPGLKRAYAIWSLFHGFSSLIVDGQIRAGAAPGVDRDAALQLLEDVLAQLGSLVFAPPTGFPSRDDE
jgi:AcrR family transcriptional regulator